MNDLLLTVTIKNKKELITELRNSENVENNVLQSVMNAIVEIDRSTHFTNMLINDIRNIDNYRRYARSMGQLKKSKRVEHDLIDILISEFSKSDELANQVITELNK